MRKPLVTVVVPVYNHELFVQQQIESIVQQTYGYDHIQLIVFDDFSTDNSKVLLEDLANQYQYAFVANAENKGLCYNLNRALELTLGDYVCFTASDDVWALDKLEKQVAYMEKHKRAGVCSGNVIRIDAQGKALNQTKQLLAPARVYEFKDVFLRDFPFSATCAMIRKEVFDEVGGYDEKLKIEDYYMWLKIAFAGFELHFMEEILGYYRIHENNTINKVMLIFIEVQKILKQYNEHPLYPAALKKLKTVYFPQIAKVDKKKAWKLFPAAISNTRFFYRGVYHLLNLSKS